MKGMVKAFLVGFVSVSLIMLLLQFAGPFLGVQFTLGWNPTFKFQKSQTLTASWFTPILVGLLFALVEAVHQYKPLFHEKMKKKVVSERVHDLWFIIWHCLWGISIGFVGTALLFALLVGVEGSFSIPFILSAEATKSSVTGSTTLISIGGLAGLVYGIVKLRIMRSKK